jgi:hypothetical protein
MRELNYINETIEKDENPALRIGSVGRSALSTVYLMDCIEGMKQFPDKIFDLAVVDPPYGINFAKTHTGNGWIVRESKDWDKEIPNAEYFAELRRVSKNQIIWGANYMTEHLPPSMGWIFWDKGQRNFSLADGELAYTSYQRALRVFRYPAQFRKVFCVWSFFIPVFTFSYYPTITSMRLCEIYPIRRVDNC